jgi:hypothetical protein
MLPLPSRTHPKNQTPAVYTEELTHLIVWERKLVRPLGKVHFRMGCWVRRSDFLQAVYEPCPETHQLLLQSRENWHPVHVAAPSHHR